MLKVLLILSVLFVSFTAQSQSPASLFAEKGILLKASQFEKGVTVSRVGMFYGPLIAQLEHPIAVGLAQQAKRNRASSILTGMVGLGLSVAGLMTFDSNQEVAYGLSAAGLGLAIVSIPLSVKSDNQIREAVFQHNRTLLLRYE